MKYFIITVDTEGDDLWNYHKGEQVKTENSKYIPRFQSLCEEYGFKPVYLTNYEMVCDDWYVNYIRPKAEKGLCEVGIHIHAWNNPPYYELNGRYGGNPYLIEYPESVMKEKIMTTASVIKDRFGTWPVSHRAGRWAMNKTYFQLLKECGIKVDCSYTPHINWNKNEGETVAAGSDYSGVKEGVHDVDGILEVPVSIRKATFYRFFQLLKASRYKSAIKALMEGYVLWERPAICNIQEMHYLTQRIDKEKYTPYIEMMLHSSELMPGGSPYYKDQNAIEILFEQLHELFNQVSNLGYHGITLDQFARLYRS